MFGERDSDIDFFFPHEIYSCYLTEEVVFETSCDFFFILMLNPCGWIMSREVDNKQTTMKILV